MAVSKSGLISEIFRPTLEEFIDATCNYTKPAIVKGVISDWAAFSLWNIDYFRSKLKTLPVVVRVSSGGIFGGDPVKGFAEERMPFQTFLNLISGKNGNPKKYYLAQNCMDRGAFSILLDDLAPPKFIHHGATITTNIWLGPGGIISPLHFDTEHNLFAQISGIKRFVIFSPDQTEYLYPFDEGTKVPHFSQVNIDDLNAEKFPRFKSAVPTIVDVGPGDVVFLPIRWWHQVYSLAASISVNFWWNVPDERL